MHRAPIRALSPGTTLAKAHVSVSGGIYDGCVGVVVNVSANAPARPSVRLIFDTQGRGLGSGHEIDLRQQPSTVDVHILPDAGIPPDAAARQHVSRAA